FPANRANDHGSVRKILAFASTENYTNLRFGLARTGRTFLSGARCGHSVMDPKPVALISMPALSGKYPSFQLALLKPTLEKAGIPAQAFSLFMYFGTHVGWRVSEALSDVWPCMAGEWIWSKA